MELRTFAERVLLSDSLEEKLLPIEKPVTDETPGEELRILEPGRPADLVFAPPRAAPKMPHSNTFNDPVRIATAHHIMANHELQALEVMAYVLLRFPEAPHKFRLGLADIMADEQRHTRMHAERAERLGVPFGSQPVNCYIWKKALEFTSVLDYLAGLPLTFEGRNLDHTIEFATMFRDAGDQRSAAMMEVIHRDEIEHVAFGLEWLRKLKPESMTDWEAYESHLHWPLRPEKSCGDVFQLEARRQAGMDEEFIQNLLRAERESQQP